MIDTPEVLFTRGGERNPEGTELTVRWTIETRLRAVPPEREAAWRGTLGEIGGADNWRYDLYWQGGGRDLADRPALAGVTPRSWAEGILWALLAAGVAAGLRTGWRTGEAARAG